MKTVAITTLGCKINQFESAAMVEALAAEGFQVVPFAGPADIYLINTCTVTAKTDAESRRLIRRAARQNPAARIAVTGCYAQVAFEELRDMAEVDLILGNSEKKGIATLLKEIDSGQLDSGPRVRVSDISLEKSTEGTPLESFAEHTRAFLQVQNGCDAKCAYCIVPAARGNSRSVPPAMALEAIATFASRGFREVVLTGIHLGGYGLDLIPPTTLLDLLAAVEKGALVERLRIGSVEPTEVADEMIRFLATAKTVCPHLHIPLQSGSDSVLARMNRTYPAALFRDVVEKLATAVPDICLGTDVITGFPGETAAEFAAGYDFLASLPLAYLHVFPFSPRAGTPAAAMANPVQSAALSERAKELRKLSDRKKGEFYQRFLGRELQVLVQRGEKNGLLTGLSRNYIPVLLRGGSATLINSEVTVRVTGVARDNLIADCAIGN
jgi:threonylcarbamoyladenosine tRNA methylthiotransferase MtaB